MAKKMGHRRTGFAVKQPHGFSAYVPKPLPPSPPVDLRSGTLSRLLSDADRALGRLDGVCTVLPDPDLFVGMYVRQEAVLSSRIEGTQSTLDDVLRFESAGEDAASPADVSEVYNYVRAMNHGLEAIRSDRLPLCLRLIREVHAELLSGTRGQEKNPGQFRKSQNWIGPAGCTLSDAQFVPPPVDDMKAALSQLEAFVHDRESLPHLVACGLAHVQFETIHPFLDGNGRVGRLLITLMLCERGILERPLLYLSYYFNAHKPEYYDRLMAVRTAGDWEGWLEFFLTGVREVSLAATDTAREIAGLRERHRTLVQENGRRTTNALRLLDELMRQPTLGIQQIAARLDCRATTASDAVKTLEDLRIIEEISGRQRNRQYRYSAYVDLFHRTLLRGP